MTCRQVRRDHMRMHASNPARDLCKTMQPCLLLCIVPSDWPNGGIVYRLDFSYAVCGNSVINFAFGDRSYWVARAGSKSLPWRLMLTIYSVSRSTLATGIEKRTAMRIPSKWRSWLRGPDFKTKRKNSLSIYGYLQNSGLPGLISCDVESFKIPGCRERRLGDNY